MKGITLPGDSMTIPVVALSVEDGKQHGVDTVITAAEAATTTTATSMEPITATTTTTSNSSNSIISGSGDSSGAATIITATTPASVPVNTAKKGVGGKEMRIVRSRK